MNKPVTDTFNFKEHLVNVKLKDIDSWASKNLSTNWVTERTKIFRKTTEIGTINWTPYTLI